eukprot:COSAG03_NODE_13485_length_501_cov_1.390547_1_plen_125_part_10
MWQDSATCFDIYPALASLGYVSAKSRSAPSLLARCGEEGAAQEPSSALRGMATLAARPISAGQRGGLLSAPMSRATRTRARRQHPPSGIAGGAKGRTSGAPATDTTVRRRAHPSGRERAGRVCRC